MSENQINYAWIRFETADGAVYPFAIDPATYVKRDIVDFAPRSGGGDVAYSNLDLYQLVTQDSWHHGIGFVQFRDKFGCRITSDSVDCRHVGMALMFQKYAVDYNGGVDLFNGGLINSVDFAGNTYFNLGSLGVWKRTIGGTWTRVLNATVVKLLTNGAYLVASISAGRMKTSSNGTSWTDAGVSGNPPDNMAHLEIHNGFMWGSEAATDTRTITGTSAENRTLSAGDLTTNFFNGTSLLSEVQPNDLIKIGTTVVVRVTNVLSDTALSMYVIVGGSFSVGNGLVKITYGPNYEVVHFWSSADSSDAEGGGVADIGAITVGAGSLGIKNIVSFNGALHIARPDGVWAVDDSVQPPVARRVLSFSDEQNSSNFAVFIPWRGRLYLNIKNALYAYNGSSLANVTPPTYDLNYPPAGFGGFIGATYRGPFLYVLASDNASTPHYHLLAFDGTGWFSMSDLGTTIPTGISYSPLVDKMFIGFANGIVWSIPFQAKTELPYPQFEWGGQTAGTATDTYNSGTHDATTHTDLIPGTVTIRINFLIGGTLPWYYIFGDDGAGGMQFIDAGGAPVDPPDPDHGTVNYSTGVIHLTTISGLDVTGSLASFNYLIGTQAHHFLNLSEIDFGFRRVTKSFAEIDVEVYNVAAGRYVAVDYSADGGSWQRLGHTTASGVTKLIMNPTVEANKLDVRMDFMTLDATQTAVLRNFTIKAMVRPDTLYGHRMAIIGANEIRMLDNRFNPGSSEEQRLWIEALRSSKAPVTFIDHFGVSHQGYISTAQFSNIDRRPGEAQSSWICNLNVVEVR